jgi:hypothetical protein
MKGAGREGRRKGVKQGGREGSKVKRKRRVERGGGGRAGRQRSGREKHGAEASPRSRGSEWRSEWEAVGAGSPEGSAGRWQTGKVEPGAVEGGNGGREEYVGSGEWGARGGEREAVGNVCVERGGKVGRRCGSDGGRRGCVTCGAGVCGRGVGARERGVSRGKKGRDEGAGGGREYGERGGEWKRGGVESGKGRGGRQK